VTSSDANRPSERIVNATSHGESARWIERIEDSCAASALLLISALPILSLAMRNLFSAGIPGNAGYVQNLTLYVGYLGAVVASRKRKHLSLTQGAEFLPPRMQGAAALLSGAITAGVSAALCWASWQFVITELDTPVYFGGWLPIWAVETVLPLAFAVITSHFLLAPARASERTAAAIGILAVAAVGFLIEYLPGILVWSLTLPLILGAVAGVPIYALLGGVALLLYHTGGLPIAALPIESYRIAVSTSIPTIPIFALTGYILAEGGASRRLVRLFGALFGWLPGGLAIVTILVCAFFSAFTGASGITIVAMAGLLLPVLLQSGYPERFSRGLLTSTGSIGLLFPPSLAVILYGVVAHIPIPSLFKAGIVPGLLLVLTVCLFGAYSGFAARVPRQAFDWREAGAAAWQAKWDILLPVLTLVAIFGGFASLVEAAAITVAYTLLTEVVVHRELHPARDLPRVLVKCTTMVGGVFIIMGVAMGLANYLVDTEFPMRAAAWVQATIDSKVAFLLALNIFLILVGCLMDIYSAIVVVVPLILPIGNAFEIAPLHLAIIFLINLELGYLTPPVGMNLFLAAYRFEKPVVRIAKDAIPFFLVFLLVLLLVTYFPALIFLLGEPM
jgi:tripartite ATP-independent transporter DctM subunit